MNQYDAYLYSKENHNKPGFDLDYYQNILCQTPAYAYWFALRIPGANIEYCEKFACKNPLYAYYFAREIPGANIEYCQEYACKISHIAYLFAKDIPGANIEYCRKNYESDKYWLIEFDKMIIKKAML